MTLIDADAIRSRIVQKERTLAIVRADGYAEGWNDLEVLGRCYYYLKDPQGLSYLSRAADLMVDVATTPLTLFHQINLYRMAEVHDKMREGVLQMRTMIVNRIQQRSTQHAADYEIHALAEWIAGNDADCIAVITSYRKQFSVNVGDFIEAIEDLADARLNHRPSKAQHIADEFAQTIRKERIEPWASSHINLYDLHELATQIATS